MATSSDPHGHHDWHSPEYVDDWIGRDVTRDDERRPMLRRLAEELAFASDAALRVLDVGGGYAMLTSEVLDVYPNCRVVLHDFSLPMFERARERLGDRADRVDMVVSDLRSPGWVDVLDGEFDAVVSSIALHNVRDPDRVREIYAEWRPLVRDGGKVANLDLVFPGLEVETQLGWLRAAGFEDARCAFEYDRQALMLASAG
jgi:ubiquinone/menaquinone biosynthesis C-methylase UbiE